MAKKEKRIRKTRGNNDTAPRTSGVHSSVEHGSNETIIQRRESILDSRISQPITLSAGGVVCTRNCIIQLSGYLGVNLVTQQFQ